MLGRLQQASRLVKQWAIIDCRTAAGAFSSHAAEARESMQYDVCIVGAGPAGLSAAIKLKQVHNAPRMLACCQCLLPDSEQSSSAIAAEVQGGRQEPQRVRAGERR